MTTNLNYPPDPNNAPEDAEYVLTSTDSRLENSKKLLPGTGVTIVVSSGSVTVSSTGTPLIVPTYITKNNETSDLPNSYRIVAGTGIDAIYGTNTLTLQATSGGSGTVTTFSSGNLSPLFTTNVANPTTTPSLSYTLVNEGSSKAYIGPESGANAAPTFRYLVLTDLPSSVATNTSVATAIANKALTDSHVFVGNGSNIATDVAVTGDLTISNTGVTAIGTNKVTSAMIRQSAAKSVIGRSVNSTGNVADISATGGTQFLGTNSAGTVLSFLTLVASSGLYMSNDGTTLLLAATGGSGGGGTVTSVTGDSGYNWFTNTFTNPTTTPTAVFTAAGVKGEIPTYTNTNVAGKVSIGVNSQLLAFNTSGLPVWTNALCGFASATISGSLTSASNSYQGIDASAGAVVLTLAAASSMPGKMFCFKNITVTGSNTATVAITAGDTIEGSAANKTILSLQIMCVISDGVNTWRYLKPQIQSPSSGGTGSSTIPTTGQVPLGSGSTYTPTSLYIDCGILIDGASSVLQTGDVGQFTCDFVGTIQSVTILGQSATGSCVFNIYKSSYANYPTMTSIVASAKPTVTSAYKSQDTTLTGWTTSVSTGDVVKFTLESVTNFTQLSIIFKILRTG